MSIQRPSAPRHLPWYEVFLARFSFGCLGAVVGFVAGAVLTIVVIRCSSLANWAMAGHGQGVDLLAVLILLGAGFSAIVGFITGCWLGGSMIRRGAGKS